MEDQHNDATLNLILKNQIIMMSVMKNLLFTPGVSSLINQNGNPENGIVLLLRQAEKSEQHLLQRKRDI